jgi:hypothetical protein
MCGRRVDGPVPFLVKMREQKRYGHPFSIWWGLGRGYLSVRKNELPRPFNEARLPAVESFRPRIPSGVHNKKAVVVLGVGGRALPFQRRGAGAAAGFVFLR